MIESIIEVVIIKGGIKMERIVRVVFNGGNKVVSL